MRIDLVHLGGADEREIDGRALLKAIRTAEQARFMAKTHSAQHAFQGIVGDADPASLLRSRSHRLHAIAVWIIIAGVWL